MIHLRIGLISLCLVTMLWGLQACQFMQNEPQNKEKRLRQLKQKKQNITEQIQALEQQIKTNDTTQSSHEQLTLVNTHTLTPQVFRHYMEVHGSVEAKQNLRITPEISGRIDRIYVEEGDRVQKGEQLVALNKDIIRQNIEEVKTSLSYAKTVYERQKNLWEKDIGSEIEYLRAKNRKEELEQRLTTLQTRLNKSDIKAPVAGTVDDILLEEGEMANPAQPMIRLVNFDKLYVNADVSEAHLGEIHKGDTVKVIFPALGKVQREKVIHIGQVINPNSRTFPIKVTLSQEEEILKPNLMALIKINDMVKDSAIVVPSHIIQQDVKGDYLFVVDQDTTPAQARKKYVSTGTYYGGQALIKEGLQAGEQIVVGGYNEMTDGRKIAIGNNKKQSTGKSGSLSPPSSTKEGEAASVPSTSNN